MRTFGEDYEKDLSINKLKLDEECEVQPSMYYFYSMELAKVRAEQDLAKDNLEATKARREKYYRITPDALAGMKPVEGTYCVLVSDDKEVQDAQNNLRVASEKVGRLFAAVNAAEMKNKCLDNLVKLQISNYYANSEPGRDDRFTGK